MQLILMIFSERVENSNEKSSKVFLLMMCSELNRCMSILGSSISGVANENEGMARWPSGLRRQTKD